MKRKDIFLAGEGNAWFNRNGDALAKQRRLDNDPLLVELLNLNEQLAPVQGGEGAKG